MREIWLFFIVVLALKIYNGEVKTIESILARNKLTLKFECKNISTLRNSQLDTLRFLPYRILLNLDEMQMNLLYF